MRNRIASEMDDPDVSIEERVFSLSARQTTCLRLVVKGLTSKEIARELSISPSTVDNHVAAAVRQLGSVNRAQAAQRFKNLEREFGETLVNSGARRPWQLPPVPAIGGRLNQDPMLLRGMQIAQLSLLSIVIVAATISTIVGIVQVLSP